MEETVCIEYDHGPHTTPSTLHLSMCIILQTRLFTQTVTQPNKLMCTQKQCNQMQIAWRQIHTITKRWKDLVQKPALIVDVTNWYKLISSTMPAICTKQWCNNSHHVIKAQANMIANICLYNYYSTVPQDALSIASVCPRTLCTVHRP